jgi:hypothetical protein
MMKKEALPLGKTAYESSLLTAAERVKSLKGTHFVAAGAAQYLVPGCVGQAHIAVAKLTGKTPGTKDWVAACMYATAGGASENLIKLMTDGPRNNVWRDCANGLKNKLTGYNVKKVCPVSGKSVVHHMIRRKK